MCPAIAEPCLDGSPFGSTHLEPNDTPPAVVLHPQQGDGEALKDPKLVARLAEVGASHRCPADRTGRRGDRKVGKVVHWVPPAFSVD